jgi:predicted alpha-1,6-mannanase (GH76 family)
MKPISHLAVRRMSNLRCRFAAIVFVLGCAGINQASAQWTAANADTAFNDYNNAFYFDITGSDYGYRVDQGSTSPTSFWMAAEQIEMVVDAYNQSGSSTYKGMITQLVNGFNYEHSSWWNGADKYDDDLMWATIAFIRAYQAVGTSAWLTDAEDAFSTVYNRGLASNGGIYWYTAGCSGHPATGCSNTYENSAANWTFVIAGILLYNETSDSTYLSDANGVFSWAYSNLYDETTGEIYDAPGATNQYSYNYGTAIGAMYWEGYWGDATNVANYEMSDMGNYSGTLNGYNILADGDSSENGSDGGGFAGIALRWTAYAYNNGAISNSDVLPWMQANVDQAWSDRNSSDLTWANWESATASSGLYSWDCGSMIVGMMDVPVP